MRQTPDDQFARQIHQLACEGHRADEAASASAGSAELGWAHAASSACVVGLVSQKRGIVGAGEWSAHLPPQQMGTSNTWHDRTKYHGRMSQMQPWSRRHSHARISPA